MDSSFNLGYAVRRFGFNVVKLEDTNVENVHVGDAISIDNDKVVFTKQVWASILLVVSVQGLFNEEEKCLFEGRLGMEDFEELLLGEVFKKVFSRREEVGLEGGGCGLRQGRTVENEELHREY